LSFQYKSTNTDTLWQGGMGGEAAGMEEMMQAMMMMG
jgi:hypothetical protein